MAGFKKGESGNPKGRPKGRPDTRHLARYLGSDRIQRIIDKLAEQAEDGDTQAASFLLSKTLSGYKPETPTIDNFELNTSVSLSEQAQQITQSVAAGILTPDQGKLLIDGITAQARILETSELEQRILKLEAMQ